MRRRHWSLYFWLSAGLHERILQSNKLNTSCHHINGTCAEGCAPGYQPANKTCNIACPSHYYGNNCIEVCGHCKLKNSCHHVNGTCADGCAPGYQPEDKTCNIACQSHYYGNNCIQVCGHCKLNTSCHHINGTCAEGCDPGYQQGDKMCKTECAVGTYGLGCVSCSQHCYGGNNQCDRVTGFCKRGCEPGYMEKNCTKQCTNGMYGRDCNDSCGNCFGDKVCYASNGSCPLGCRPGFKGDICKTECENGKYGINCVHYCHCQNDSACNKTTGQCPDKCDIMWSGDKCSENKSFIYSIVKNVVTRQSGTYMNNTADKAIDGVDNYLNESCDCCSVAKRQNAPQLTWWEIDLGQKYLIAAISIFSRSDGINKEQIQTAEVHGGNKSLTANFSSGSVVYKVPSNIETTQFHFGIKLDEPIISRFFAVIKNESYLSICEFMLEKADCPNGSFGNSCLHRCHCKGNTSCDLVTGHCPSKFCEPGWQGDACDTVCGYRTFGDYCNTTCHCVNNTGCDHAYGTCNQLQCEDGWTGSSCSSVCTNGTYGRNCNESCSNCFGDGVCYANNGSCPLGCKPGFKGDVCKTECDNGKYGINCINYCHCLNDTACNKSTGQCPSQCDIMWSGDKCSEDKNFIYSIAKNIITTQSGTYRNNIASNAIDGVYDYPADFCGCCSLAKRQNASQLTWWEIDLGQKYLIAAMSIFSRSDGYNKEQIRNAEVHAGNQSLSANSLSGSLIYRVPSNIETEQFHFGIKLDEPIISRFFTVSTNEEYLTICEFMLEKTDCPNGSFGNGCLHRCHCKWNTSCDPVTGRCPTKFCEPGWQGDACDTVCAYRTFGDYCNTTCHCVNDSGCDHVYGTCNQPQCEEGWTGSSCSSDENLLRQMKESILLEMSSVYNETWTADLAIDGKIGPDPKSCHCCSRTKNSEMSWWSVDLRGLYPLKYITIAARRKEADIIDQLGGFSIYLSNSSANGNMALYTDDNKIQSTFYRISLNNTLTRYLTIKRPGVLTICEVVLIEGECVKGYFGENCSSQCNCLDKRPCDRTNGTCVIPFCRLGWTGPACDKKCDAGTFGEGCSSKCFCAEGDICSHDFGICPGKCIKGYQGPQCNLNTTTTETADLSGKSITIGASVGASIIFVLMTSLVVIVLYRRRSKPKKETNEIYTQPDFNMSTNTSEYDTLDIPESQRNRDSTIRVSSM